MVYKEVCRCRYCGFEFMREGFYIISGRSKLFQLMYKGIPVRFCPKCGAMDSFIISSEPAEPVKSGNNEKPEKPVVYLYPTEETEVSVKLTLNGTLTCTYPSYENGWHVIARPDGTLTNLSDNKEYSYLYWEGISQAEWDMSRGFVVQGKDTAEFLQGILQQIGLTPREYNEFIVYWLPKMQDHAYNLITFQQERYTQSAQLSITPNPDKNLRVFMVFKELQSPIDVKPPQIIPFEREGFTVVEWGGAEACNQHLH